MGVLEVLVAGSVWAAAVGFAVALAAAAKRGEVRRRAIIAAAIGAPPANRPRGRFDHTPSAEPDPVWTDPLAAER